MCVVRDPDLVRRIGVATALEVRATGIQYTFAPCIAVRTFALFVDYDMQNISIFLLN